MAWTDKRPMSPHLQVYRLPLTAYLSILHRGTGVALFLGFILLCCFLAVAAAGPEGWGSVAGFLSSWFGKLVIFGFTFSLYLHFCSGVRHLIWDIGIGLDLEAANKTNLWVLVAAAGLTVLTWLIAMVAS